jgi:hypothetical protein
MQTWRALIQDHRKLAMLLVFCALCMKALVPQGYMIGTSSMTLTVQLCTDGSGVMKTQTIEIPVEKGTSGKSKGHGKSDGTCAFSSLAMAGTSGADPIQLDLALGFILLLGFVAITSPQITAFTHIRPPLRGPPAAA